MLQPIMQRLPFVSWFCLKYRCELVIGLIIPIKENPADQNETQPAQNFEPLFHPKHISFKSGLRMVCRRIYSRSSLSLCRSEDHCVNWGCCRLQPPLPPGESRGDGAVGSQ